MAKKKVQGLKVKICGKEADLSLVFPLRLKDWKELENRGLSLTEPANDAESVGKMIHFFLNKVNEEISEEDVDEVTMQEMQEIMAYIQEQVGGEREDPSS